MTFNKKVSALPAFSTAIKIALCVALCVACAAFGQQQRQQKARIAVYVTGTGDPGQDNFISQMLLEAIVKEYAYYFDAIDRNEMFLEQMSAEHMKQRGGMIDETQIAELGKQAGVDYLCIGDITQAFGAYVLNARINNLTTARVVATGRGNSRTLDDIEVVDALMQRVTKSMGNDLLRNFR